MSVKEKKKPASKQVNVTDRLITTANDSEFKFLFNSFFLSCR